MNLNPGGLNYLYHVPQYPRVDYSRKECLQLALNTYGAEHPPAAIIEAAELFYEYLTGESDEVAA